MLLKLFNCSLGIVGLLISICVFIVLTAAAIMLLGPVVIVFGIIILAGLALVA